MPTLYVNASTGNDSRTYAQAQSSSTPWLTIGRASWGSTNRSAPVAAQAAQAGDTVEIAAGSYSFTGVLNDRHAVAYNCVNEGTNGNPIRFVAAGVVNLAAPNANGAVIGSEGRDYVEWYADVTAGRSFVMINDPRGSPDGHTHGVVANPAHTNSAVDTGPAIQWDCTGCKIEGVTITGLRADYTDNYNGVRFENAVNCTLRNCTITGFRNLADSINGSAMTLYGSINLLVENNTISDCGTGVMNKDAPGAPTGNSNRVRYNRITNCNHGLGFSMTGQLASYYYQNIIKDCAYGVIVTGGGQNNYWIFNNLFIDCLEGGAYFASPNGTGGKYWNNIWVNARLVITVNGGVMPADSVIDYEHNCYFNYNPFYAGNDGSRTFASFKAAYPSQDQANPPSIDANPLFVNQAAGDYHLQAGSPCRNLGVDLFDIDGDLSTVDLINAGPYVSGSETIGVGSTGPSFTSGASATFTVGTVGSHTVTTSPAASTITRTGTLPSGVTFVDNLDGTATIAGTPGAGTGGTYTLTLTATNSGGSSTQTFVLTVRQAPVITSAASTIFTAGSAWSFTVTTTGFPAPSISRGGVALPTGVTFTDNGNGTGTLAGTPAAGTGGSYAITFTATNSVGSTAPQAFSLTVRQAPAITSANNTTFTVGSPGTFTVTTSGFPAPSITRGGAALPSGVSFVDNGNGTGTLSGTPGAGVGGTYTITFTPVNILGSGSTQTFTLTVRQLPAITSGNSVSFNEGVAGTFTVTTSGFPVPTIGRTGSLPAGVTFTDNGNGTGTLAGTPGAATAGVYPLTFTPTNAAGSGSGQAFTLTVVAAPVPPSITSASSVTFQVGNPGTFTVTTSGSPTPSITRGGASLPAGVTFVDNGNGTGTLSGTPNAGTGATYAITFTATNSVGSSSPQAFTLTVNQLPVITSANNATFTVGSLGSHTVTATGFPTPTITRGGASLPSGVTFNGGVLSGTPGDGTGGTYALTFTATNAAGSSATQSFTLTVRQTPTITSASSATFTAGTAGSFTVTTTGFPFPSIARGGVALPAGVTFTDNNNGTGTLAGTPAALTGGTYALTFTATNVVGSSGAQSFTLTVRQVPTITSLNSTTFTAGVSNTFTVTTAGFPVPAITRGGVALPTGVTFTDNGNGTGTLAGTPTTSASGTYAITFTATNVAGSSSPQSFSFVVAAAPVPQFTSANNTAFTVGTPGSFTVTTNPAAATITCSASGSSGGGTPTIPAGLLPSGFATRWAPGVRGIPNRTTIFDTIDAADFGNGSINATAAIQASINACPAGQVVKLSAGTFLINDFILINKAITLRGSGIGAAGTTLLRTDTDQEQQIIIGPSRFPRIDETTAVALTSNAVQGAMSVTVTSAAGFAAGQFVKLDEDDYTTAAYVLMPARLDGSVQSALQSDRLSWPIHNPPNEFGDLPVPAGLEWHSRSGRPLSEIKEVASVSGNTITFTTPIHIGYTTAKTAQLTRYTGADNIFTTYAGVEDLTTDGGRDGNVSFLCAAYSWMRNVEVKNYGGAGVDIRHGFRNEVRDSYIRDTVAPRPGGGGYALSLQQGASETLIENNIIVNANKVIVSRSAGAGCVVGYNYMDDAWIDYAVAFVEVGINGTHMIGSHHILFEGNLSFNYDADDTWGSCIYMTVYRNWLTGQRRSFADTDSVRCAGLMYASWWHTFMGNVLGRSGLMSDWIYEDPGDGTYGNATSVWGTSTKAVWRLGYSPGRWGQSPDPLVRSRCTRDGNYDYVNNDVSWDNAVQTLPNSLYLTSKPTFFSATQTWPWVDALGSTKTYELPAYQRFLALQAGGDLPGGFLPAGITFTDNGNGTATIAGTPLAGTGGVYSFTLTATNASGTTVQTFTLTIRQTPAITSAATTTLTIGTAGTFTITATGFPTPTLSRSGSLPTGVSFTDNGNGTATLAGTPGGGTAGTYPLTITATNAAGATPQSFSLIVVNAPPGPAPLFTSANNTTFTVGTPGTFSITTSPAAVTISSTGTLPSGVTLVDNGGGTATLSGTPAAGTGGTYSLVLTATNDGGSDVQPFTLTVRQVPAVTSAAAATFTVGIAGSFTVTATGFPVPSISRGGAALPSGVSFTDNGNGTGTLSGTPGVGTGGSYSITFTASNAAGSSPAQAFVLTVNTPPANPPQFTSLANTTFTVGSAGTFTVTTSPAATSITRAGTLPSGVTFTDNGNGTATLAGTPAAGTGGNYGLTFTATNSGGSTLQSFTLAVRQLPAVTSGTSTTMTAGASGSFTVTTSGVPTPSISRGGVALPSGVSFTDNGNGTGTLSGIPAAGTGGTYSITFTATNSVGSSPAQAFTLTVRQLPNITSVAGATFEVDAPGSFTVTTTGFPTPSIARSGTLPAGVTFVDNGNGTGTLSGTPVAGTGGVYSLAFTATNVAGSSAAQAFSLVINESLPEPAPVFTSGTSTTFTTGTPGVFNVATNPEADTITVSGTLPNGVTFVDNGNGTATISGTPAAEAGGVYSLTFLATNTGGSAIQGFTLTVRQIASIISPDHATFTENSAGTFTVTATGYPIPDISLSSGSLPPGLTFTDNGNGNGTIAGTPTQDGIYALQFTATNVVGSDMQSFTLTVTDTTTPPEEPPVEVPAGEGGEGVVVHEYRDFIDNPPEPPLREEFDRKKREE